MAENKSGAQHLASLDLDVSGVFESLKKVDEDVREKGLSIGKNFKSYFDEGLNSSDSAKITAEDIIDSESLDKARESVGNLSGEFGTLKRTVQTLGDSGEVIGQKLKFVNDNDVQTVVNYNSELKKTITITKDIVDAKKEQLELDQAWEKQLRSTATEEENYAKKGLERVDADLKALREKEQAQFWDEGDDDQYLDWFEDQISQVELGWESHLRRMAQEQEEYSKRGVKEAYEEYSASIEKQIKQTEAATKQEDNWYEQQIKAKETAISQIDTLIVKQQQLSKSISSQPSYLVDQDLLDTLQSTISKFSQLRDEIEDSTIISPQQQVALSNYVEDFKGLMEEVERYLSTVKQYDQITSQLESLVKKQKAFNDLVSNQKTSTVNRNIIKENDELIKSSQDLIQNISQQNVSVEDARKQFENLKKKAEELSDTYDKVGTKGESFLEKISDKAKWLAAFYVVNELKNGFFETIGIIKETEDAVVDLQRVLNDDSISNSKMSAELYDIAYEYGRTFAEVAEVSTQFAQAGNDWADTVELTRGTMLALNTAELDVTQSTEGLIAIMSQWNLEAEDYADVIDKINITADNFAVTSETIVAALQRSSSSAKNANISLEETISIITALAEATGRSGENIGTALNSLIIYTSKTDALKKFAEVGSDTMKQIVADYQAGAASIFDVWEQLSEEVQNLSQQQQEVLFQDENFQELATELQSALGDVYGAAGTYRQNYFIALLNDMDTVQRSMQEMEEYAGYSARENEKYMESLTASWNQLKAALAELAVQLGNTGLLNFLKFLTETATAAVKLTQSLGGVVPLLATITGLFTVIKQQKISSALTEIKTGFELVGGAVKGTLSEASKAPGIMGKLNVIINALSGSSLNLVSAFGLVSTAIGVVYSAYKYFSDEAERTNQALLESSKASLEAANSIDELKEKYIQIMDSTASEAEKDEQLAEIKDTLLTKYGLEKDALDKLNESREAGLDLLEEESKQDITEAYSKIASQYKKAREELESTSFGFSISSEIDQNTLDILERYGVVVNQILEAGGRQTFGFEIQGENIKEQLENLNAANAALQANGVIVPQLEAKIKDLNKVVEENAEAYDQGTEAFSKYLVKVDAAYTELRENVSDVDSFNAFRDALVEAAEGNEDLIKAIDELLSDEFPEFVSVSNDAKNSLDEVSLSTDDLDDSIQSLSDTVSSFQSAYATVTQALEEYNQTGILSISTIESIIGLGPEYISMLEVVDGKLRLNEEAVGNLINAQRENVIQMLQQGLAADTLELAQQHLKGTTDDVATAQGDATDDAKTLSEALGNVQYAAMRAASGLASYGEVASVLFDVERFGYNKEEFERQANELFELYSEVERQVLSIGDDRDYWTGASGGADDVKDDVEDAQEQIDNLIDKLNDLRRQREEAAVSLTSDKAIQDNQTLLNQIYSLISGLQDGTITIEEATEALEGFDDVVSQIKIEEATYKKLVDEQETLAKDQLELQDMVLEREKERLEAEKEAIEERYDYEEERISELSDYLDDIRDFWEYANNRKSLLREIRNAESRVGVEYRIAERDAREELQQLDAEQILNSVDGIITKAVDSVNDSRDKKLRELDDKSKSIDKKLDDLADIKSLIGNTQADLYERFGGDLSDISSKVGNVDEFLSSIGYIAQIDESQMQTQTQQQPQGLAAIEALDTESAIYEIAKTSLSSISDMIYESMDMQDVASQELFTSMSSMFIQSASSAISVAMSQGMSSLSSVIAASVASAIAAGGSTTNSTTNYNTTNLVGSIASSAGSATGQALWDFAMQYFTKP